MYKLGKLANFYGSDKGEHRLNGKGHNYTKTYDKYFLPFKDKPISILEIGVRSGVSLFMWRDYFPSARIYGFDIHLECQKFTEGRIKVFIGDQGKSKDLKIMTDIIKDKFTIIIDDGSHKSQDIITSLHLLKSYLEKDGLYFIEDMDPNQDKEMVKIYIRGLTDMKLLEYVESETGSHEELGILQKL